MILLKKFEFKSRHILIMCKKCHTFYYKKSWHLERPEFLDKHQDVEVPVRFTECLACMEEDLAFSEARPNLALLKL